MGKSDELVLWIVKKGRPSLLLEVLLAFFLVALCAIPLMQSQFAILKAEYEALRRLELDRLVNRLYAMQLVAFYQNRVDPSEIGRTDKPVQPVALDDPELKRLELTGTRQMRVALSEGNREYTREKDAAGEKQKFLLEITYRFQNSRLPSEEPRSYSFNLYVKRPENESKEPQAHAP